MPRPRTRPAAAGPARRPRRRHRQRQSRALLVGTATSGYQHRPDLVAGHPHTLSVAWGPPVRRADLPLLRPKLPGQWVHAIAALTVDEPTVAELAAALSRRPVAVTPVQPTEARRRRSGPPPPDDPPSAPPAPPAATVLRGRALLATVPRRAGRAVSWVDPLIWEEKADPCPRPDPCPRHTRHRYWLPVKLLEPQPGGPNVLVVAANPTCPDGPAPHNETYARVARFGDLVGAASMGMANVVTARTGRVEALAGLPRSTWEGPRQARMLEAAFRQADLVVLAPGVTVPRLLPDAWSALLAALESEQRRGLVVARPGPTFRHPMLWPVRRRVDGEVEIVADLEQWLPAST